MKPFPDHQMGLLSSPISVICAEASCGCGGESSVSLEITSNSFFTLPELRVALDQHRRAVEASTKDK